MATVKKRKPVAKASTAHGGRSKRAAKKPLLIHSRHSFKLVPHRHTSYPLMLFMLLLTGVFCVGWTNVASGDSYKVNAVILAPPLTTAATITTPSNGAVLPNRQVTVRGSCPDHSYVKLSQNNEFAGASMCENGSWSLQIILHDGSNLLEVQDYNVTDQPGPVTAGIIVTYQPPQPSPGQTRDKSSTQQGTKPKPGSGATPLGISAPFTYKGYFTDEVSQWPLTIHGGTPPYALQVDWGDGQTDLQSIRDGRQVILEHSYGQAAHYSNGYIINLTVADSDGTMSLMQLFAIISQGTGGGATAGGSVSGTDSPTTNYRNFWGYAAPTLGLALVAIASFWLGERRELELLRPSSFVGHRLRPRH